jgi:hypothetical protein
LLLYESIKDGLIMKNGVIKVYPELNRSVLKPATARKYRRERREFVVAVAKEFGIDIQVIDRLDGAPKVTELVMAPDGLVKTLEPAISYIH